MRPLSIELRFDFAEKFREYSLSQKVRGAITGKAPEESKQQVEEEVLVRSLKRKLAVRWNGQSLGVVLEEIRNIDNFIEITIPLLNKINEVAPINNLTRRTVVEWLLPTPKYDFAALEKKYREIMIGRQFVQNGTFDSSVVLDIKVNNWTLHHQSGAMGLKQLLDHYLVFKQEDLPKVFLFLIVGITDEKVIQYSSEEMHDFLTKAFKLCKSHSDAFEQMWEAIL